MGFKENSIETKKELTDDDKLHIMTVFQEDVAPRLMRMDARLGNISCEFAGVKYRNWVIEFRSSPSGFSIVDFDYDEEARGIDLAPMPVIKDLRS